MTSHNLGIRRQNSRPAIRRRRGFAVIASLTCLLIVVAIVGSMLQSAIRARRELLTERDCRQSQLLLAAGADRAAARLAAEPTYRGDVWELPAEAIIGRGAGRVTTEVSRAGSEGPWQVHVVAEYPTDRGLSIRRSHTFQLNSSMNSSQE